MKNLAGKKILILATNGFEQSELEVPRDRLKAAGATVEIASPASGEIKGWDKKDWGRAVKVDRTLSDVSAAGYDAIITIAILTRPATASAIRTSQFEIRTTARFSLLLWAGMRDWVRPECK